MAVFFSFFFLFFFFQNHSWYKCPISSDADASGACVADELNLRMNALNDFKQAMVQYYNTALRNYDCENPCTFKSVCLKCNMCRILAQPVSCCFYFCDYVF